MNAAPQLRPGERIPGSKYYRAFCGGCEEAIRVPREQAGRPTLCDECAVMARQRLRTSTGPKVRVFK